ncbi:MAG: FliG C-terminal domain-containing protein [Candidatus Marinimicrobia bacterium]|jgi:flagellar motor switch protein FliG|nr:FliG C-terminal domain-containing protein [Candidatus Neomarinimicrobiota bacterium]
MISDYNKLSGLQKVAILFSVLGESLALNLVKSLDKTEVRKIRAAMRDVENVAFSVKKQVMEEFYFSFVSEKFQGNEESDEPKKPFAFLDGLTDEQIIAMLITESPRVIAISIAQLSAEKRMKVLSRIGEEEKGQVLLSIGNLNDVPLEAVVQIANKLQKKAKQLPKTVAFSRGGGKDLADILGSMDPEEEEMFMTNLEQENPELAEEVKKYRITFETIFEIFPDNLLRDLMNAVDLDTVAMALKGMDQLISDRVIGVLPKKKQAMYEPVAGAVPKRDVDNARKSIVQSAKQMESDGAFKLEDLLGGETVE